VNILHLSPDYPNTKSYGELVRAFDKININQLVYIPIKKKEDYNKNIVNDLVNANFVYSKVFNNIDRLFYNRKINKILSDIENKIDFKKIDLVHAHSLFSMGGIALKLKKEKNIDYIVTVQNTDVNLFFKYMFHIRKIGINVMKEAKKIVFNSPAYKEFVINKYIPNQLKEYINQKSIIIPFGINPYWLQNKFNKPKLKIIKKINLIYIGEFTKNKNVHISIKVARRLKKLGYEVKFIIVGGNGEYEYKIRNLAKKNKDIIDIYECIEEREKLLNMYQKSDIFIMPSRYETFGLVYIEAMSQGLPIIYTKGEGIDGYFKDGTIGYSVNPQDINDIIEKIEMIINNYNKISKNCLNLVEKFSWSKIAKIYYNIYMSIV
jgi:L-malate glycosyltransferase